MIVRFTRDDLERRLTISVSGDFSADDWHSAVVVRLRDEDVWSYGILYDLRGLTEAMAQSDIEDFVREGLRVQRLTPRGPVAIVAADQATYVKACEFVALTGSRLTVKVFRFVAEADAWLTGQMSRT
jgi:hypothetical protein